MYHQLLYKASVYLNTGMIWVRQRRIHLQAGFPDSMSEHIKVYKTTPLKARRQ